jgi:DNA-binding MarR family transcriptional regulator
VVAVAPLAARWIERLLGGHDPPLTPPQYLALRAISREPVSVSDLARRAAVSGPAATQLVNALAAAALIDRRPDEDDRRRQLLALSAEGERALASADALLAERLGALLEPLPPPEVDALARALPVLEAALAGTAPPRRPAPPPPRHGPPPRPRGPRR